jgi:molecular chaperone GrpE (heat shock protein)
MQDLHVATIKFLNPLLKLKQLQAARAAHTEQFETLNEEFENLRRRLCLEIEYAMQADGESGR